MFSAVAPEPCRSTASSRSGCSPAPNPGDPLMARPHIVIVGAGFGGLEAAHRLGGAAADVTVVDRRNYHLFQPLLYQVATAGLSPAQIASPIRAIVREAANVRVLLGRVVGVDKESRTVT